MKQCKALAAAMMFCTFFSNANNVLLQNISVANNAANTGKVIEFDLSWENSWRVASTGNWDGVWVFFKFRDNDGTWYPLQFTGEDIVMPAGATYELNLNNNTVGMFIYRSDLGTGTAVANNIQAGIQSYPGTFEVRGYAIEMVYIPQGNFYLGDGASLDAYGEGSGADPFLVSSNGNAIHFGTAAGELNDPLNETGFSGTIAGFPTGYAPFWVMKYEVSQGAYRDFLNTLTYSQQLSRFWSGSPPNSPAGTILNQLNLPAITHIEIVTPGSSSGGTEVPAVVGCDADGDDTYNETTDGEWKAMNQVNWGDVAAYLDWAGLRPLTELEFEKICRGPLVPVASEYAWGTDGIAGNAYTILNAGAANELISNMSSFFGNAIYTGTISEEITRGGIFATAFSTRVSAGAGYYGSMELSGNLHEFCVTTANAAGRSFNGKHGDGILTENGNANENFWPGINGSTDLNNASGVYDGGLGVRAYTGTIRRGGGLNTANVYLRISTRNDAYVNNAEVSNADKFFSYGIRGARSVN